MEKDSVTRVLIAHTPVCHVNEGIVSSYLTAIITIDNLREAIFIKSTPNELIRTCGYKQSDISADSHNLVVTSGQNGPVRSVCDEY